MRISVNQSDPGYVTNSADVVAAILCDGVVIKNVITADTEAGTVLLYSLDIHGKLIAHPIKEGCLTHQISGRIEILFYEGMSEADLVKLH